MLSAHRGAGSFRHDAAVGSWLHRIVVNACLDRLRRTKVHPTVPLEDVYPVPDRTAPVETAVVVQRALMRLPVEQRAAVVAVERLLGRRHRRAAGRCRGDHQEPMFPRPGSIGRAARLCQRRLARHA